MKKSFKLISSLCTAVLALGVGVALNSVNSSKEVKAATETTVYYAISDADKGSYTLKANVNRKGDGDDWKQYDMTSTGKKYGTLPIYSCSFTDLYDGLGCLQFQLYDGSKWISQKEAINTWTKVSVYNGKLWDADTKSWVNQYKSGRYIVGLGGNWDIEHAIYMSKINDKEYSASTSVAYGDTFKIAYYNGSSLESYYGYPDITPNAQAYVYFGNSTDNNIKCYAEGTYAFYFTDGNYDTDYKISCAYNGTLTAQHLSAKLMSYGAHNPTSGDTNACRDGRFTTCKTIYNGLSDVEKTTFQGYASSSEDQFNHAYQRYCAWSRANGEEPFTGNSISPSIFNVLNSDGEATISIIIIVVVSVVSLTAICGFFYYKKRKQN